MEKEEKTKEINILKEIVDVQMIHNKKLYGIFKILENQEERIEKLEKNLLTKNN